MLRSRRPLVRGRAAALVLAYVAFGAAGIGCRPAPGAEAVATPRVDFAAQIAALSEPGGYFDSDNLISNERSYLHVIGALRRLGVRGGAYIGVGPDQNFSYIAQVRPSIAFMFDVRRDNLIEHLLFKSVFGAARTRVEYLALLTGRPVPADVAAWRDRSLETIVAYLDSTEATPASEAAAREAALDGARRTRVPLTDADAATFSRFHGEFIASGLELRYTSRGRPSRAFYPTLRDLLLERDLEGERTNYLAREEDFQFVKSLQARDLIIPVTGNLGGEQALAAVGRLIAARGERVSVLYTSNAEDYLMRDGAFARFARTVAALPRDRKSVIIRSYFGGFRGSHPYAVPGYPSTQLLQTVDAFAAAQAEGAMPSYVDLVTRGAIDPRPN
ncbi:MAG: LIC_10091 family protein [Gemmatirosa sp.]